jgi:hypothetical protein
MNLESVGQLVAQHSLTPLAQTPIKIQKAENERAVLQRMVQRIMWGMLILGIGIIFLVANKSFDLRLLSLLASAFTLGGAGLAGYGVLAALRDGMAPSGGRLPVRSSEAADVKSLPTEPVPLPLASVTEGTTQLFTSDGPSKDTHENLRQDVSKTRE